MTRRNEPFRHIMVATDFSDASRRAAQWAIEIARGNEARVSFVHAVHAPRGMDVSADVVNEVTRRLAVHETAVERENVPVESYSREGKPWEVVGALADELAPDLVVLGSRGRSAYARVRLGSTADRVIRAARAPVLTVPPGEQAAVGLSGPVVVAIDFSEESALALDETIRLVRTLEASQRIELLHACDFAVEYGIASGAEVIASARAEEAAEASRQLELIADGLRREGLDVDVSVREGYAATIIEQRAEQIDAGLIALGTLGRSGLSRLMMGSVAERVLHHASCPVLTANRTMVEQAPSALAAETAST